MGWVVWTQYSRESSTKRLLALYEYLAAGACGARVLAGLALEGVGGAVGADGEPVVGGVAPGRAVDAGRGGRVHDARDALPAVRGIARACPVYSRKTGEASDKAVVVGLATASAPAELLPSPPKLAHSCGRSPRASPSRGRSSRTPRLIIALVRYPPVFTDLNISERKTISALFRTGVPRTRLVHPP